MSVRNVGPPLSRGSGLKNQCYWNNGQRMARRDIPAEPAEAEAAVRSQHGSGGKLRNQLPPLFHAILEVSAHLCRRASSMTMEQLTLRDWDHDLFHLCPELELIVFDSDVYRRNVKTHFVHAEALVELIFS